MVVPEKILVRETLHACQGISGRYLWWVPSGDGGAFKLGPETEVPPAQRQAVFRLAEVGVLLKQIEALRASPPSPLHEALSAAAARELSALARLLAILEHKGAGAGSAGTSGDALTLRRLEVWLAEPRLRLRVLAGALAAAAPRRGGQALDALRAMSRHGDPMVRGVMTPLLEAAAAPLFRAISSWVLEGTLVEGADFFVIASPGLEGSHASDATAVSHLYNGSGAAVGTGSAATTAIHPAVRWRSGHSIDPDAAPALIPAPLARAILDAGRAVHFLKHVCQAGMVWHGASGSGGGAAGSGWAAKDTTSNAVGVDGSPRSQALAAAATALSPPWGSCLQLHWLEEAVETVRAAAGAELVSRLFGEHALVDHLAALRAVFLLGQGDLAAAFMDAAGEELHRPAREVSQYALQGHLHAALRACASPACEAVAAGDRLVVRLARPRDGDSGWDVVSLHYAAQGALAVVLNPGAMATYQRIWRLLVGIRRAERALAATWARLGDAGRALTRLRALEREHGTDVPGAEQVPAMLRAFHSWRSEAAQAVANLQCYVSLEVLEPGWNAFMKRLPEAKDLDTVLELHEGMLAGLTEGLFLDGGLSLSTAAGGSASAQDVNAALNKTLHAAAGLEGPVDGLAESVEAAVAAQGQYLARVRESEALGTWTDEVYNSPEIEQEVLTTVQGAMWQAHAAFERQFRTFLAALPAQGNVDTRLFLTRLEEPVQAQGSGSGRSSSVGGSETRGPTQLDL